MSEKREFGAIDLNNHVELMEEVGTLMGSSTDQGEFGGRGSVDGFRVLEENKGLIEEVKMESGKGGVGVECSEVNQRDEVFNAPSVDEKVQRVSEGADDRNMESLGFTGRAELLPEADGEMDMNRRVLEHFENSAGLDLVVDLNMRQNVGCEYILGNGIGVKDAAFFDGPNVENSNYFSQDVGENVKHGATDGKLGYMEGYSNDFDSAISRERIEDCATEKDGEYYVSDLVWAKVRSHPWWPGQIFHPTAASEKAMRYFKRDTYLIAYFGDQTFAWNEASKIKPFFMYFSQMAKQSNVDAFSDSVNCALVEVSQRVEFGLSCSCLREDVVSKINHQVVRNAGIREESSRIDRREILSPTPSFIPVELFKYLKLLGEAPNSRTDKLELVIAKAQLLAFNRWKGHYQLPVIEEFDGLLEDGIEVELPGSSCTDKISTRKKKSPRNSSSRKRKCLSGDDESPKRKAKYLSDLTWSSSSTSLDDEKSVAGPGLKMVSSSVIRKRKVVYSVSSDSKLKRRRTSDRSSKRSVSRDGRQLGALDLDSGKSHRERMTPADYPPPLEMLSELRSVARDPMKKYSSLGSIVSLFCEVRNTICSEKTNAQNHVGLEEKHENQVSETELTDTFAFEGMEDSYWTDRIIQSTDGQVLFEPGTTTQKYPPAVESEALADFQANSELKQGIEAIVPNSEAEHPSGLNDENLEDYSPTALILNFTDLESVPSVTNLNKIFSQYGPLQESGTEVLFKSKRAKVIFKRRSDAETAFSSTGKYTLFGPSLRSYRLSYSTALRKTPRTSKCGRRPTPVTENADGGSTG